MDQRDWLCLCFLSLLLLSYLFGILDIYTVHRLLAPCNFPPLYLYLFIRDPVACFIQRYLSTSGSCGFAACGDVLTGYKNI